MPKSIGIDLGTTYSAAAIVDPVTNMPKIIPNLEGGKITPSVIQFINGKPIFGTEAESAFNAGEPNCVTTFKRYMGKTEPYCYIDDKEYTAEQLSALLLRHLKETAEEILGDTIKDAVITVPAYFYSLEREATINAAKAAGITVKKIIDEPNAAALAYGLNNWRENANILVYDLGGGTFDVTLTRMGKDNSLSTITTKGDHQLGGRDWDNRILTLILDKFAEELELEQSEIHENLEIKAIARGLAEGIKKQLSSMDTAKVTTPIPNHGKITISITKTEFDNATIDLLERTGSLCEAIIKEAGLNKNNITDILLVGGSTRMPQVTQYITKLFNKKPITHVNPDEAVALGAAIQATKENESYVKLAVTLQQDGKKIVDRSTSQLVGLPVRPAKRLDNVDKISLQETTAHAMGIIAISPDNTRYINDCIIPANHIRPVKVAKAFTHITNTQGNNDMTIFVLQGDKENPLDNQIPHKYVVSDIRHIPRQRNRTLIRVQYSYDHNGVIHVEARQEQDNVNLPIRKEVVPNDMSIYGLPVDTKALIAKSDSVGVYSKWAGVNHIPTASLGKDGNPEGAEYDLIEDGTFNGEIIYVLNLCHRECPLHSPNTALSKKGFCLVEDTTVPSIEDFKKQLNKSTQLWIISDREGYLNDDYIDLIEEYFNKGHGVYIWGDNNPYYVDANKIMTRLFNTTMSGDSPGSQVVSLCEEGERCGVVQNHLISTGIVNIFEGITIAEIHLNDVVEPLVYGSNGLVVTAFFEQDGKRAIMDGGFTRLCHNWDSAGTNRYIVNAAAWLVNLERFAPKQVKDEGEQQSNDRYVETW